MEFHIEFEIPPMRGIYYTAYKADDEEQAREFFRVEHPRGKIRRIEGSYK